MALQAKEQEGRQKRFDAMNKQTIDIQQLQQQQIQQFMRMNVNMMQQQQQQQTLAFMELMKKFAKKLFCLICARVNIFMHNLTRQAYLLTEAFIRILNCKSYNLSTYTCCEENVRIFLTLSFKVT